MNIDEAIKHCIELAEQEECFINYPHSDIVRDDLAIESRKHFAAEQRQIAKWLKELKETKRLLKMAVDDMQNSVNDIHCKYCSKWHSDQCQSTSHLDCYLENKFVWRYATEALALIGKDGDSTE